MQVRFDQPVWILKFLRDEVQVVPTSVGEQAGIEGYSNTADTVVSFERLYKMGGVSCRDMKYKEFYDKRQSNIQTFNCSCVTLNVIHFH